MRLFELRIKLQRGLETPLTHYQLLNSQISGMDEVSKIVTINTVSNLLLIIIQINIAQKLLRKIFKTSWKDENTKSTIQNPSNLN